MSDILELSARIIDSGDAEGAGPLNRITTELSALDDDVALIEAFSHVAVFRTAAGLVLFDTSLAAFARRIIASCSAFAAIDWSCFMASSKSRRRHRNPIWNWRQVVCAIFDWWHNGSN